MTDTPKQSVVQLLLIAVAGVAGGLLFGLAVFFYGNAGQASIVVDPPQATLTFTESGRQTMQFTLRNPSSRDIRCVGYFADCGCTSVSGIPIDIPAGGVEVVETQIASPEETTHDTPINIRFYFEGHPPHDVTILVTRTQVPRV